ncbi:aminotransferase class I/II-fold pyridoxal phosphate-dependent enzyme, partial [Gardnerella vaginalis]
MDYKHRSILDSLPNYKQGKPAPALDGIRAYKISSNENPFEPLESVKDAISNRALGVINRYPNMRGTEVVEELAKKFSVTPDEVVLGCGSTEVITQLVDLVAGPGDEVIYPWRSFEAYPIIVTGAGATSVKIPNRADGSHDV